MWPSLFETKQKYNSFKENRSWDRDSTAYAMTYQPDGYKELIAYQLAFNEAMRLHWLLPPMLAEEEDLLVAKLVEDRRLACAYLAEARGARRCRDALAGEAERSGG